MCMRGLAFTLIELLIVVAIIAILAAILFPVFGQAKLSAQQTKCLSNIRQSGVGIALYLGDSDDQLPVGAYGDQYVGPPYTKFAYAKGSKAGALCWADLIQPYVRSVGLLKCPTDSSTAQPSKVVPGAALSYGLSCYFFKTTANTIDPTLAGPKLSAVTQPADKILIAESSAGLGRPWVKPDMDGGLGRHRGASNYVFIDGHAKHYRLPGWWPSVSTSIWEAPNDAASEPCPQWFFWLDTAANWS